MGNSLRIIQRYKDYYCEELIEGYLSNEINLEELISKLDYNQVKEQSELFNFLNLLMTNKFQRRCYNEFCNKLIYFSDAFNYAKMFQNYALKEFSKIWIGPDQLKKKKKIS